MHSKKNKNSKKQGSDPIKDEPGVTTVRCPHLKICGFSGTQSKKVPTRCRGVLCRINHWESCLVIGFKCQWLRKRFLLEINGNDIRHIPRHSSEHQEVLPQLKQLFCEACKHRVLDYHVVYGEAVIDVKCSRDGHFSSHVIK